MPDIQIKDREGDYRTYENVNTVVFAGTNEGETFAYSYDIQAYYVDDTDTIDMSLDTSTNTITSDLKDLYITKTAGEGGEGQTLVLSPKNHFIYTLNNFLTINVNSVNAHIATHLFVQTPSSGTVSIHFPSSWAYAGTSLEEYGNNQFWEFSIDSMGGVIGYHRES